MKVLLIAATTLCGRISPAKMGSNLDRKRLEEMRSQTDASLMGAQTLRSEDARMHGPGGKPDQNRMRAVMTESGRISPSLRIFLDAPPPIIFTGIKEAPQLQQELGDTAIVKGISVGPNGLSVAAAISVLAGMGAESVLIEGGGRLNYAALAEDVVDELHITLTQFLSGDSQAATLADGTQSLGNPFLEYKLVEAQPISTGEVFLRYVRGEDNG